MKRKKIWTFFLLPGVVFVVVAASLAGVIERDGKVFISDRRGEKW